jgi:hypothetical protein
MIVISYDIPPPTVFQNIYHNSEIIFTMEKLHKKYRTIFRIFYGFGFISCGLEPPKNLLLGKRCRVQLASFLYICSRFVLILTFLRHILTALYFLCCSDRIVALAIFPFINGLSYSLCDIVNLHFNEELILQYFYRHCPG